MRAIVTGQVGMDKRRYLDSAVQFAGEQGETINLYNVGDMMYGEAPDVRSGRILDLPLSRLNSLRRAAIKDIIAESRDQKNLIVNTHATFRWRHGLFPAFDFDQIEKLNPDVCICLVDNIEMVHHRLHDEHDIDATLKDCMVWREEEILATELLSQGVHAEQVLHRLAGTSPTTARRLFRLVCRPDMRKVYPSFPMTHVVGMPDVLAEIDHFRAEIAGTSSPSTPAMSTRSCCSTARWPPPGRAGLHRHDAALLRRIVAGRGSDPRPCSRSARHRGRHRRTDLHARLQAHRPVRHDRVADVPELPGGMPGLSSGVERELQHAFEHTKEVYVVWKPAKTPSPFITETATKIFTSVDDALTYFEEKGMFAQKNLFGH
jgi:adenylate kinase